MFSHSFLIPYLLVSERKTCLTTINLTTVHLEQSLYSIKILMLLLLFLLLNRYYDLSRNYFIIYKYWTLKTIIYTFFLYKSLALYRLSSIIVKTHLFWSIFLFIASDKYVNFFPSVIFYKWLFSSRIYHSFPFILVRSCCTKITF